MDNRDVKRLLSDGHIKIVRGRPTLKRVGEDQYVRTIQPLSPKKFEGNFRRDYEGHLCGSVNLTLGIITEDGKAFLAKHVVRDEQPPEGYE